MLPRTVLSKNIARNACHARLLSSTPRRLASAPSPFTSPSDSSTSTSDNKPSSSSPSPSQHSNSPLPKQEDSWLTKQVKASPAMKSVFLLAARALGYGSPQQFSNRRALALYNTLCATRVDEESAFWLEKCALPPTFQTWFTITNLHVWLLTVRLRALPSPHGRAHVQGLIDHFFQDTEERVRAVLQPGVLPPRQSLPSNPSNSYNYNNVVPPPSTTPVSPAGYDSPYPLSTFYPTPTPPPLSQLSRAEAKALKQGRAPERIIVRQMKILKEQWNGMGFALDLGLVQGDAELAAVVWRNMLGARGAQGIEPSPASPFTGKGPARVPSAKEGGSALAYRRHVNLVGGEVENVQKLEKKGIESEETRDDGSGVHDFGPEDIDRYLTYPDTMHQLVTYIRREVSRLEKIDDAVIMGPRKMGRDAEGARTLRWGSLASASTN
ncbi:hypothetical protein CONPUDRAFT_108902 [Coniophora puteana RWD-64-598 SS2]|uniref:Ubiquinol-cytochrome c chaperone domain-containing protein n=1 Tax=Coniophora puteana (strain RWD-64-598) TaxID=741705 RepID=A0A5M3MGA2_CONPW|nr:uncharacterized protein CONPUDRAFT_108902 [Coniophora puteana RWD-64-598 SS2]EIW77645.1 hypothetical protein CONPUDRAFT_108902 [Coniophora puteana RWD-64-598 SS2]